MFYVAKGGDVMATDIFDKLNDEQLKDIVTAGFRFQHRTLEEYVELSGRPLKASEEVSWGEPVGREIW